MKQMVSEKYSVAWFKLADYIARGEKERALGIYRLLSHSFDDPALAFQLQADILLSFDDEGAQDAYKKAAALYRQQGQLIQCAAVHEHLVMLQPANDEYRTNLIELYAQLNIHSKATAYLEEYITQLLARDEWKKAGEQLNAHESLGTESFRARLHERLLFYLMDKDEVLPDTLLEHARAAIDAWSQEDDHHAIETMLAKMRERDAKMEGYAREYWEKIKN